MTCTMYSVHCTSYIICRGRMTSMSDIINGSIANYHNEYPFISSNPKSTRQNRWINSFNNKILKHSHIIMPQTCPFQMNQPIYKSSQLSAHISLLYTVYCTAMNI